MTVADLQQGEVAVVKSFLGGLDTQSRFMIIYMNVLAYLISFLIYQGGLWLGFS